MGEGPNSSYLHGGLRGAEVPRPRLVVRQQPGTNAEHTIALLRKILADDWLLANDAAYRARRRALPAIIAEIEMHWKHIQTERLRCGLDLAESARMELAVRCQLWRIRALGFLALTLRVPWLRQRAAEALAPLVTELGATSRAASGLGRV